MISVTFSENSQLESIGQCAFLRCGDLESIILPNALTIIGGSAFQECTSLYSVTISDNVTNINGNAFYFCYNLQEIHFNGTRAQWENIEFGNDWDKITGDYTIYCTNATIDKNS